MIYEAKKSGCEQLLASDHQRAPDNRWPQLAGLWLCTQWCNCLWMEGVTFALGMKRCICFPIVRCLAGAR